MPISVSSISSTREKWYGIKRDKQRQVDKERPTEQTSQPARINRWHMGAYAKLDTYILYAFISICKDASKDVMLMVLLLFLFLYFDSIPISQMIVFLSH